MKGIRRSGHRIPPRGGRNRTFKSPNGNSAPFLWGKQRLRGVDAVTPTIPRSNREVAGLVVGALPPAFTYNATGAFSDYYLSLAFGQVMFRYEDNAYDVVDFTGGVLGSVLGTGTLPWPPDYMTTGTLEFVADTGTEWLLAHVYTTSDFFSYWRLAVRIVHINKTTYAASVDSEVVIAEPTYNDYTEAYFSPRAVFDGTRLTVIAPYNDSNGNDQNFGCVVASCVVNTTSGAVSGALQIAALPWHTEVGSFQDNNYGLPVTPVVLHDGAVALPFTTGSHVTATAGERQGCYVWVVDPASSGLLANVEVSTRPSFWGALSGRATDDGLFLVTALNDDINVVTGGNRGEWTAYHFGWNGSVLSQTDSTTFVSADYLDDPADGSSWLREYGFSGNAGAHETEVFGSDIVTVYSADDGRHRWALIPWSVSAGTISLGAATFYDLVTLAIVPSGNDLLDGIEHRRFNRLSVSDDGYYHHQGRQATALEHVIGARISD